MRLLLLFFISFYVIPPALAQKNVFKKAEKLYKQKDYGEAIPAFESALKSKKSTAARTKLAYCYKMLNKNEKARLLYKEIVASTHVKPSAVFHYGEVLMNLGEYQEGKRWLEHFLDLRPGDERASRLLASCEQMDKILPVFELTFLEAFEHNTMADENSPVFFKGGIVFASDRKSGANLLQKKAGTTGRDYINLFFSRENAGGGMFEMPQVFSGKFSIPNKHTGSVTFSADASLCVFSRNGTLVDKRNNYNLQLYMAESEGGDKWKNVEEIAFCSKEFNYMHPALSADGKYLYFASDKAGGEGGMDIYVSMRTEKGWSKPWNLGPEINTSAHEGFPFMDENGWLYFCSKGHVGFGGFDVFYTEKDEEGRWSLPTNLGTPFNSSSDDISICFKRGSNKGAFTSSRQGGNDDIFIFELKPEGKGRIAGAQEE